nr:hypothetical protein [Leeuwenhoekiella aestuarii]
MRCLDRNYLDKDSFQKLNTEAQELIDQIGKFSNYLKKSEKRGSKFD